MTAVYECVDCDKVEVYNDWTGKLPQTMHIDHNTKLIYGYGHQQIPAYGKLWCPHLLVRR